MSVLIGSVEVEASLTPLVPLFDMFAKLEGLYQNSTRNVNEGQIGKRLFSCGHMYTEPR